MHCILSIKSRTGGLSRASETKRRTKITNMDFRTNLFTDDAQFIVNEIDKSKKRISTFISRGKIFWTANESAIKAVIVIITWFWHTTHNSAESSVKNKSQFVLNPSATLYT